MVYRIKVKRRFLPIWRMFHVIDHKTEVVGSAARLILTYADGSKHVLPDIHKREAFVYPTYRPEPQRFADPEL